MKTVTQMGVPIINCDQCGYRHPMTRTHCPKCGLASAFTHPTTKVCLHCIKKGTNK